MSIESFRLAWRWTSPSHTPLPPEVLETLVPLEPEVARAVYELTPGAQRSGCAGSA